MRNRSWFAAALLLLTPAVALAQRADAWRDSAQRIESMIKTLRDSLVQGDSGATEAARHGDLVIAASPDMRASAIDALERFRQVRDRWFGSAMPAPGGFRIVMRGQRANNRLEHSSVVLAGLPDTGSSVRIQSSDWRSGLANGLIDRYGEAMLSSLPLLAIWLQSPPLLSMPERERRDLAMYDFVTGMGPMQRDCVSGNLDACRYALDIRHAPSGSIGSVFTPFMRADLLYFTLDQGGPGAWNRLQHAAAGGVEPALLAAAGMPIDSLLVRWHDGLLALRPAKSVLSGRTALAAFAWSVVLLLGALGASRWG